MGSSSSANRVALSRCAWLLTAAVALWGVLAAPAWLMSGSLGLVGLSLAAALCVVPGLLVFWLAASFGPLGAQVPLVILAGSVVRMVFVFLGLFIVQSLDHRLGFREFTIWLLAFYLSMLAVETVLVLQRSAPGDSNRPPSGP